MVASVNVMSLLEEVTSKKNAAIDTSGAPVLTSSTSKLLPVELRRYRAQCEESEMVIGPAYTVDPRNRSVRRLDLESRMFGSLINSLRQRCSGSRTDHLHIG